MRTQGFSKQMPGSIIQHIIIQTVFSSSYVIEAAKQNKAFLVAPLAELPQSSIELLL